MWITFFFFRFGLFLLNYNWENKIYKVEIWQTCKCAGIVAKIGVKTELEWLPQLVDNFLQFPVNRRIISVKHTFSNDKYIHKFELKPHKRNIPIDDIQPPVLLKVNFE